VQGWRATRFLGIFPTTFRGAAEPGPDSDPHESQPDKGLISVPATGSGYSSVKYPLLVHMAPFNLARYQDPLHILLKYIAEVSIRFTYFCVYILDSNKSYAEGT
jgi:hypothetical protein